MRVGVAGVRFPVSCPAGVPDANPAMQRQFMDHFLQAAQFAGIPPDLNMAVVQHSHAAES